MGSGGVMKRAARRVLMAACGTCYCYSATPPPPPPLPTILGSAKPDEFHADNDNDNDAPPKKLCAICLEALRSSRKTKDDAIFTAQCSHAFHLSCISSNIRHGNLTCPICRSHWTRLPRNLPCAFPQNQTDPVLRILDNSIASLRFRRRSLRRSALHDHDDPTDTSNNTTSLDLVMVASANGRNLKLVKQAMALVIFSLRPIDRLAIVTPCSPTAQTFPLRRMTMAGKRSAVLVVDSLFHVEQDNPAEGLNKGINILKDRAHMNPESIILHLVDCPGRTASFGHIVVGRVPTAIHRFHLGFGFGSNRLVMQEFEELVSWLVGGAMRDVEVRIREEGRVVSLGELRKDQERRILLGLGYSYMEGVGDAAATTSGERVVSLGHDNNKKTTRTMTRTSISSEHAWGFRDPYMAMRWAKHLDGYRF